MSPRQAHTVFIDESGDPQRQPNIATGRYYVLAAIIVPDSQLPEARAHVEAVRRRFYGPTGEIKSVRIGEKIGRRVALLRALASPTWKAIVLGINKAALREDGGFAYRQSAYKFLHRLLFTEFMETLGPVSIIADNHGRSDFMRSCIDYYEQHFPRVLFDSNFDFASSRAEPMIGLADIVAGSVRRIWEYRPGHAETVPVREALDPQLQSAATWPANRSTRRLEEALPDASPHDALVAQTALDAARRYVAAHEGSEETNERRRVALLRVLIFQFESNPSHPFISTAALREKVGEAIGEEIGDRAFRSRVIGALRDQRLLIASGKYGLKLPGSLAEFMQYIIHDHGLMLPLLGRVSKARAVLRVASGGALDILHGDDFAYLREVLAAQAFNPPPPPPGGPL